MNMTLPSVHSSEADWSSTPVGAPTYSFSAFCAIRAASARSISWPYRSARAKSAAHSSAAEEDSPAPCGTSEWIAMRAGATG
jgi:hypothetical protein